MPSMQVMVNTPVNDKGLHATAAVVDKGMQTEDIMNETTRVQVDEADVRKLVNQDKDHKIIEEMTHLSKGRDGNLRILCGPGFLPIIHKGGVNVNYERIARCDESIQVHARTKPGRNLFPNRIIKQYHACVWRDKRTWRTCRIKRKESTCGRFVSATSRNIQTTNLHVLKNRKGRSLRVHANINRPAVYVWKRKTEVEDQSNYGNEIGCTTSHAGVG